MESVRLTKNSRQALCSYFLAEKFAKREAAVFAREQEVAIMVYEFKFPEKIRRMMARLPSGWLLECNTVEFDLHGYTCVNLGKRTLRFPYEFANGCLVKHTAGPLYEAWGKCLDEHLAIGQEREKLRREINAVLWSAKSTDNLLKIWPEAAGAVRAICKVQSINLPVPRVDLLNRELGLVAA